MEEAKTAQIVREELEKDVFLQNSLAKGFINNSALARELLPIVKKKNPKATLESVTVSISRHSSGLKLEKVEKDLMEQIANSQISLKNDIIHSTFLRNNVVFNAINEISKKIRWDLDEILFINQGGGEITVVFDKKNEVLFNRILSDAVEVREDSAILSIREPKIKNLKPSIEVPGLYAYFIGQISKNGINILDIISTRTQITFVLKESDITKAYGIINNCIKYFRKKQQINKQKG